MRAVAPILLVLALGCERSGEASYAGRSTGQTRETSGGGEKAAKPEPVLGDRDPAAAPREDMPEAGGDRPEEPLPDEPAPPEPPADYGLLKPTTPPPAPEALTLNALAEFEVVAVHDQPSKESPRLGYLRIGSRTKVGPKVEGTDCPKGWYPLPQGGYACASKGLTVSADREPFMKTPPPPARVDQPLPYEYAYVKRWNSPMWWRVPTREEIASAEVVRTQREAERIAAEAAAKGEPAKPVTPAKPATKPKPEATDDAAPALPSVDDDDAEPDAPKAPRMPGALAEPDRAPPSAAPDDAAPAVPAAPAEPVEPAIPLERLPLKPESAWLERGYFISVGDKISEEGRTFWRTARGGFVDIAHAYKYGAKDYEGVENEYE